MPTKKLKNNRANVRRKAQIKLIEALQKANEEFIKKWKQKLTQINNGNINAIDPITYLKVKTNKEQIKYNLQYAEQENIQLQIIKENIQSKLEFL